MPPTLAPELPEHPPEQPRFREGRILIVDDEPLMRRFIEKALRAGGYGDLLFCHVGTHVPFLARTERPHLIIMDIMMPGGNGLQALRKLKQAAATENIPVILTSGFNVLTLEASEQNQPDFMLSKPFSPHQLLTEVERLVRPGPAFAGLIPPDRTTTPLAGAVWAR